MTVTDIRMQFIKETGDKPPVGKWKHDDFSIPASEEEYIAWLEIKLLEEWSRPIK